jgi:hypothetical protein
MSSSNVMPNKSIRFLRTLIIAQLLVAMWFVFSPDVLPAPIKDAERLTAFHSTQLFRHKKLARWAPE